MAKKTTKKPARPTRYKSVKRKAAAAPAKRRSSSRITKRSPASSKPRKATQGFSSPSEALTALLESPLVSEIIAAGAAAGLAAMTQHALSKRDGGAKKALKQGAKAAATAMGSRIASEIDEILKSAKTPSDAER
jgi:hypothetical protein